MTAVIPDGTVLSGYRIEQVIGRGGMGIVYLATDIRLERPVALKILSPESSADPRVRERFIHESRLAASIDHPNIVPIFGSGESEDGLWIAMRYVDGRDLRSYIVEHGVLEATFTSHILSQVARALDAAHARELIHRDVKPSNILIEPAIGEPIGGPDDHAYLTDFGLSRKVTERSTVGPLATVLGTIDYVAPEQIQGDEVDGRVDQYGLAATLFTCLTEEPPFGRDLEIATLHAHLNSSPPRVTGWRPDLPPAVDGVVTRGLAKHPEDRFSNTVALMTAFDRALTGRETPAATRAERSFARARSQRRAVNIVATIITLVALAAGLYVLTRVAFRNHAGDAAVVQVQLSGGSIQELASELRQARTVSTSSVGRRIAYVVIDETGSRHVFVKQVGEPGPGTRLMPALLEDRSPAWYKDERVALVGSVQGTTHIFTVDANGSNVNQLTHESGKGDNDPDWSRDGTMLAFTRLIPGQHHHVFVMPADGTSEARDVTIEGTDDRSPEWSPTSEQIILVRRTTGTKHLVLVGLDGRSETLTDGPKDDETPRWSPDGKSIVFVRRTSGNADIYTLNLEDRTLHRVSIGPANDLLPRWSPDGRYIAFVRQEGGLSHIFVMSPDGFGKRQLTSGKVLDDSPAWLADGSAMVFTREPVS